MGTSGKSRGLRADGPRIVAGILLGGVGLWLANQLLQPVPISAGGAYAAGALVLLTNCLRPMKNGYVVLGALAGGAPALWAHRSWHLDGASPVPAGNLLAHVLGEGLLGIAVALVCLGIAAWTSSRLRPAALEG